MSAYPPESEPRRLSELEEQRHTLIAVQRSEGLCIAKFPNGDFIFPEELESRLRGVVGQRITVLRFENRYLVRDLEEEEHAAR